MWARSGQSLLGEEDAGQLSGRGPSGLAGLRDYRGADFGWGQVGIGFAGGWPAAPPTWTSSLATVGIIVTGHSGHSGVLVTGFLYL